MHAVVRLQIRYEFLWLPIIALRMLNLCGVVLIMGRFSGDSYGKQRDGSFLPKLTSPEN